MHHTKIKRGSQWIDAHQNVIRIDRVTDHTGKGPRVHATDLMLERPCAHTFHPSQFEGLRQRRQTGFQRIAAQ